MELGGNIPRIRRVDLFGTIVPGFYLFCCFAVLALVCRSGKGSHDPWDRVSDLIKAMNSISAGFLVLIASFVLGTTIRGFSVNLTDNRLGTLLRPFVGKDDDASRGPGYNRLVYTSTFPYWPALWFYLERMTFHHGDADLEAAASKRATAIGLPGKSTTVGIAMFDYWKAHLAIHEPEVAGIIEGAEARTRMFTGMFWAGFIGAITQAIGLGLSLFSADRAMWIAFTGLQLAMSCVLTALFGWRLRSVRAQEAIHVFVSYVVSRERAMSIPSN